ncbi:MAG: hypothetical protein EBT06_05510 [Gammaproteobacteria bacterium]|jgi:ligand-binding SRPBCC domain-containing protein|nr:hypothetical protein [Gammaproteobacteria bacterium]NBT44370.1 hypothetical protein [Gammaproteobacteria bacterium]NBY23490.1 hypothetical protein [Gammaproteobacteria bacterium]NDE33652.1 hypothetical protein [Gammaproteobacteria bacterium]NDE55615.1 hypothetical protein [Gammaproteobacteria bacterium]
MALHQLHRRQFIPLPLDEAWSFFSTPRNLEAITPDFLHFKILSEVPDDLYNGLIIAYQIAAVGGIPMTWVTEIKHVVPERQFVDEQRIGPFRFWFHEHRFEPVKGGIEMIDTVHYVMPWGLLGEIVHGLFIKQRLKRIFDYRASYIEGRWPNGHP